jgi:two-component system cell cycle sensor histidine kinase/response regulator CckA
MSITFKTVAVITIAFATFVSVNVMPGIKTQVTAQERQNIRIGVYDNYPKIYRDDAGQIKGFWVDITNEIAKKENWNITYVFGTFDQGLERLRTGQLDLMVDVAISSERQQQYDFNNEYVLSGWAAVYTRNGIHVNSYPDLADKKIAVVKSDIHNTGPAGIKATLSSFGINATFIEFNSYEDVFKALDSSQADAGVVSGLYGAINDNKFNLTHTGIIFNPIQIKYALAKNAANNPYLISTIESNLLAMKKDPGSVYYSSIDENLGRFTREVDKIPTWFYIVTITAVGLLALVSAVVLGMRQYQKKLQSEIKNRIGQIKDNEEKYSAVVNQAQDGIAIIQNEKIIFANRAINIIGYPEKEVIGKRITDLLAPEKKESRKYASKQDIG